jgi:hypothetical protein
MTPVFGIENRLTPRCKRANVRLSLDDGQRTLYALCHKVRRVLVLCGNVVNEPK